MAFAGADEAGATQWWRSPLYWASGAALTLLATVLLLIGSDDQVGPVRAAAPKPVVQAQSPTQPTTQPATLPASSVPDATVSPVVDRLKVAQDSTSVPAAARTEAAIETLTQPAEVVADSLPTPSTAAAQPLPAAPQPRAAIASTPKRTSRTSTVASYSVRAVKVSVHQRQGTGRFSRAAGYNGAFTLAAPSADAQPLIIEEYIEVIRDGRQLMRELTGSKLRAPGRFGSKARIPGLKKLAHGTYTVRLVFEHKGRRLGTHEWTVQVGK